MQQLFIVFSLKKAPKIIKDALTKTNSKKTHDVLLAPTWNSNFFDLNCHKLLKEHMDKNNISYILRPHPMSFKKKEISLEDLNKLNIPVDSSNNLDLNKYRFLVSDWSGIFIEFANLNSTKCILLNTKKKVFNKDFNLVKNTPIEIYARKILGYEINIEDIRLANDLIKKIILNKNKDKFEIENFFKKYFF